MFLHASTMKFSVQRFYIKTWYHLNTKHNYLGLHLLFKVQCSILYKVREGRGHKLAWCWRAQLNITNSILYSDSILCWACPQAKLRNWKNHNLFQEPRYPLAVAKTFLITTPTPPLVTANQLLGGSEFQNLFYNGKYLIITKETSNWGNARPFKIPWNHTYRNASLLIRGGSLK